MNTNDLAKFYDRLSPRERLPLIIAAGARGDAVEQQRLCESSPHQTFQVRDYHPLAKALGEAVHYHLLILLDLAADFWQWWGLWMTYPLRRPEKTGAQKGRRRKADTDLEEWRAGGIVRYYASRFVANVDGWKQFCADLHIDPEVQLQFMIGWDNIQRTEARARELAFKPEEAAQFVALETVPVEGHESLERGPQPVERVDELVQGWHTILDELVRKEGGA